MKINLAEFCSRKTRPPKGLGLIPFIIMEEDVPMLPKSMAIKQAVAGLLGQGNRGNQV